MRKKNKHFSKFQDDFSNIFDARRYTKRIRVPELFLLCSNCLPVETSISSNLYNAQSFMSLRFEAMLILYLASLVIFQEIPSTRFIFPRILDRFYSILSYLAIFYGYPNG